MVISAAAKAAARIAAAAKRAAMLRKKKKHVKIRLPPGAESVRIKKAQKSLTKRNIIAAVEKERRKLTSGWSEVEARKSIRADAAGELGRRVRSKDRDAAIEYAKKLEAIGDRATASKIREMLAKGDIRTATMWRQYQLRTTKEFQRKFKLKEAKALKQIPSTGKSAKIKAAQKRMTGRKDIPKMMADAYLKMALHSSGVPAGFAKKINKPGYVLTKADLLILEKIKKNLLRYAKDEERRGNSGPAKAIRSSAASLDKMIAAKARRNLEQKEALRKTETVFGGTAEGRHGKKSHPFYNRAGMQTGTDISYPNPYGRPRKKLTEAEKALARKRIEAADKVLRGNAKKPWGSGIYPGKKWNAGDPWDTNYPWKNNPLPPPKPKYILNDPPPPPKRKKKGVASHMKDLGNTAAWGVAIGFPIWYYGDQYNMWSRSQAKKKKKKGGRR